MFYSNSSIYLKYLNIYNYYCCYLNYVCAKYHKSLSSNKQAVIHRHSNFRRLENFPTSVRCIRLDGPVARCSGRPKLPRQFVPVRNFEPRLFVPMPGNMGRPAFTFINLYIFCNLQRIINQNIHLDYVCIYFLIRKFVCLFVCWQAH